MTAYLIDLLIYVKVDDTKCLKIILLGAGLLTVYSPGFAPHFKSRLSRIIGVVGVFLHNFYD